MTLQPEINRDFTSKLPPCDARALEFDIDREMRRVVVEQIRNEKPTTVIGTLLGKPEGMTAAEIAEELGEEEGLIGWRLEELEGEDLVVGAVIGGAMKAIPLAAYTDKNE